MRFPVTSGSGVAEIVERLDGAKAALDRAMALLVRNEDGKLRRLADLRGLEAREGAPHGPDDRG
jgi:hypothetical protein